jgi:cytochrome c oxidase subunit 2
MQFTVLLVTLFGICFISTIFILVIKNSGNGIEEYGGVVKKAYHIRKFWFATIALLGCTVTYLSLSPFPIVKAGIAEEQVVNAIGGQWYWQLDKRELKVNQPVVFKVTSVDVNHGFAIYDDSDTLVTQVQSMPNYINELRHTFQQPGQYKILCLEFCGIAHHAMQAIITVTE